MITPQNRFKRASQWAFSLMMVLIVLMSTQNLRGQELDLPVVMPAGIETDSNDHVLSPTKVEAGLVLALGATRMYKYIPSPVRDSLLASSQNSEPPTFAVAAKQLGASIICFVNVRRFVNLVRAEVTFVGGKEFERSRTGVGLAAIRYAEGDDAPMADPAVLASIQRAIINIVGKADLYSDLDSSLNVQQAAVVVPGGVSFHQYADDTQQWELFKAPTVVSYDIVQTIVHALQDRRDVVVVDVETRDSMYATGGLYLVENDQKLANTELRILRLFEVDIAVSGSFRQLVDKATLELQLLAIKEDGAFSTINAITKDVSEDTTVELRGAVVKALEVLLPTEQ